MTQPNNSTTAEKQKTISIERTFDLPVTRLWKAFTDAESFKKWWGPENYTCPYCTIDFKVGGKYLNSMQGQDGKEIWSTGTYKEIVLHKKIVYTDSFSDSKGNKVFASEYKMAGAWELELIVTLEFKEAGDKTNLLLKHHGIPEDIYDECIMGWQSCLDKLERTIK
jgi:uncharacterized protein YndB with AHSA1/START domain